VKFVRDAILSGLWAWVTLGTEKFQGPSKRRIIMTNILVMLVSVLCVPHVIFFAIYDAQGLIVPIIIISLVAIAFQLTPILNALWPYAGGLYNLILWLGFATTNAWMFSAQSAIHFYLLAGATTAIAIFGVRQNLLSIISIGLGLTAFIYADRNFAEPADFLNLTNTFLTILYFISIPTTLLAIFCMVFYGFKQASTAEEALQREYEYSEALLANMLPGGPSPRN